MTRGLRPWPRLREPNCNRTLDSHLMDWSQTVREDRRTRVSLLQNGDAAPAAAAGAVIDTTTQTFMKDVIEESRRQPVLVDFWAPWCGPCKQLTPVLEKVVRAAKGKVKLAKIDIDKHRKSLASWGSSRSPPSSPSSTASPPTASWARCRKARSRHSSSGC